MDLTLKSLFFLFVFSAVIAGMRTAFVKYRVPIPVVAIQWMNLSVPVAIVSLGMAIILLFFGLIFMTK